MLITSRRNTSVELSNSEMPLRSSENPQKMSSSHQIHRTTTRPTFTFSQGSPIISATGYDEDDDDEDDDDDEEFMNSPLHMRNMRQSRSSGSIKRRGSSHKLIQTDGAQGPNRRSSNDSQVQMRHHSRTSSAGSSQNVIVHHYHHHHHSIDSPPPYSSAGGPSNGSETSLISSDYCTDPNPVQLWNRAGSVSSQSSDQSPVRPAVAGGGIHLQNPTVISNAASTTGSSSSTQTFFPPHASASSPSLSTLVSPASPPNAYPLSSRFPPNSQQTTAHLRQHSMSHAHGAPNDTHVLTSSRSFSVAAHSSQAQIQAQIQQQQLLQNRAQMSKNNNNNNQQPFRTSASSSNLAVMNQNASSTSADTSRERLRRRTMSDPVSRNPKRSVKRPLRILGLKMFNARFHFLLGLSRFLSVLPSIIGAWSCLYDAYTIRSSALSVSILASSLPSIIAAAAAAAAAAASESSSSPSSSFSSFSSNIHATETVIVSSPYPSSTDSIFESENIASSSSSKQPPFAFPFQKSKPPTQISTSSLLLAALNNNKVNSNDQINADLLTSFLLNPNLYSSQHQSSSSSSNKDNLYPISHHLNAILANSDENIKTIQKNIKNIVAFATVRCSELIMASIWCVVAGYLSYSVLDGLMDRWLLIYSTPAVIIRLLSSSVLNFLMVHALISIFSPDTTYRLHVWILISCILTVCYTIQNFLTSNVGVVVEDDSRPSKSNAAPVVQKRPRSVDLYNIAVFAVVPVGLASFITMVGMLRSIMVLQYQYESLDISFITAPATAIIP